LANPYPLRPNPERAIEVFGDFNDELASKLFPQIAELRKTNEPISVFINSLGGNVHVLKFVDGHLKTRSLDEGWNRIITIASGNAASAAASLLALGNYAYAYPHSYILFHSVRYSELPENVETATQMVLEIERLNREISRKIAEMVIVRLISRYERVRDHFRLRRRDAKHKELIGLRCFIDALRSRLSNRSWRLAWRTFSQVELATSLCRPDQPAVRCARRGQQRLLRQ